MTLFALIAALIVAVALAFLLPPLLRTPRASVAAPRTEANASIYREQADELAAELPRGALSQEEYQRALAELEHRIVAEHGALPAKAKATSLKAAALAIGLLLPVVAGVGYWRLGSPHAIGSIAEKNPHDVTPAQVESLVEQLAVRMQQQPNDAEGWMLLGRTLRSLGRHERSAQAYRKAAELLPEDANVLADYADALAMAQGRTLVGEPFAIIQRALKADPENLKALALA